jgi:hypothetical protein
MGVEWRSKRLIVRNSLLTIFILNVTLKETNRVLRIGMTYDHPFNAASYLSSYLNSSYVDSFVFLLLPTDVTSYVCPVLHVPSYLHSFLPRFPSSFLEILDQIHCNATIFQASTKSRRSITFSHSYSSFLLLTTSSTQAPHSYASQQCFPLLVPLHPLVLHS